MERRVDLPLQLRLAPLAGVDAKARTATLVWSTGARVARMDFWTGERYFEELSMDPAHVRLGRLQSGAPLLDTHKRWNLSDVIGVVEEASISKGEGRAKVRFSEREEVTPIFNDVAAGIIRNVSVGYVVHKYEQSLEGDAIVRRAVDWEPSELSLVPIGADPGAAVRAEQQTTYPCLINGETRMDQNDIVDPAIENSKPSAADLARTRAIRTLVRSQSLGDALAVELIDGGATLAEARARVLDELAKRTEATPVRSGFDPYNERRPQEETRRSLIAEAMASRFGGPAPSAEARQYVDLSVVDIARLCLEQRGIRTMGMRAADIITRTSHSTTDFPALLSETGTRVLRAAYLAHMSGITRIFKQSTAPDFRAKMKLALSEAPALQEIQKGGEYKRGTMAETKESYVLKKYGGIFGINWEALVNDDLNAFGDMSARQGQAAAELVASTLVDLVNSNPTLATDNKAVFHADHGNLTGTGTAIAVDSLGVGISKVRLQKGISGKIVLGLAPRFLLVPAAKEQLAKQYTSAQYVPAKSVDINPWSTTIEPIVEPRLDVLSATAWYLFTDPAVFENFEFSYLEGQEGPQMWTREGWDRDGMEFKVRLVLGAGATEFRGAYKNVGA